MNKSPTNNPQEWTRVLEPHTGWLNLRVGELWQYRDLILSLVHRDFVAQYKQTILGPLWFLLQPLLTTLTYMIVFNRIANIPTDKLPPFLFYLSGTVAWNYFSDCLTKTAGTFIVNAGIFGKVYFPRMAMPVASVASNLITFGIQLLFFVGVLAYYMSRGVPIHPSWRIIALPLLIAQMGLLGLGVGCIVSALTTRYRDLTLLVGFGTQLWLYGSCVVYPLSTVAPNWRGFLILNPMVPIIEGFRFMFLGVGIIERWQIAVGLGVTGLICLIGLIMFNHVERTFTDTV